MPEYRVSSSWYGLFLAAGTPDPIEKRWFDEVIPILNAADTKNIMTGMVVVAAQSASPQEAQTFLQSEIESWGQTIKATRVEVR